MEKLAAGIGQIRNRLRFTPVAHSASCCALCNDTGIKVTTDANGRTVASPCPVCDAIGRARERRQYEAARIPRIPPNVNITDVSKQYVDNFKRLPQGANWILFSGRAGSGKTTNASWIASEIIARYHKPVRFYSAYELTRRLATSKRHEDRDALIEEVTTTPFIVLDDFLKVFPRPSSFQYNDFFEATLEILWGRYDARMPLCITTQRDFRSIAEFDAALAGRIVETCSGRIVNFGENSTNWRLVNDKG